MRARRLTIPGDVTHAGIDLLLPQFPAQKALWENRSRLRWETAAGTANPLMRVRFSVRPPNPSFVSSNLRELHAAPDVH